MKTPCEERLGTEHFQYDDVMATRAFKAEIKVSWPRIPAVTSVEQYNCSIIEVFCFSSSETFSVAIVAELQKACDCRCWCTFLKADWECIVQNYPQFLICFNLSSMCYQFEKLTV